METMRNNRSAPVCVIARILPTRNGNYAAPSEYCGGVKLSGHGSYLQGMETVICSASVLALSLRTDPTYKEWKLLKISFAITSDDLIARILPTRNGNQKEGKHSMQEQRARILPTRNGNEKCLVRCLAELGVARILPTRNGNYLCVTTYSTPFCCTDPTYKEWKLQL